MREKFDYAAGFFPEPGQPLNPPPTFELDLWAECRSAEFDALVSEVIDRMQTALPVKRWREERTLNLRLLLCNLIQNHHRYPGRGTRFYRSPKAYSGQTRYRPALVSGKVLPNVVDALVEAKLVSYLKGKWDVLLSNGSMSQVVPKPELLDLCKAFGVTRDMIAPSADRPGIELRSAKRKAMARGERAYDLIEYPPEGTEAAALLFFANHKVALINEHLSTFSLGLPEAARRVGNLDQDQWILDDGRWLKAGEKAALRWVDLRDTYLTRIFSNVDPATYQLSQGGRFYDGWWQTIQKESRALITIDGEPTIELDYGSFHPRMIYHRAGIDRRDDLYALPAFSEVSPGFDQTKLRGAVKSLWLIALNSSRKQLGAMRGADRGDLIERWQIELPAHMHPSVVIDMILETHPEIRGEFGEGVGPRLQAIDSEICQSILLDGVRRKMPILPIHDSFVVRSRDEKDLHSMMVRHYQAKLKFEPIIDRKGPPLAVDFDEKNCPGKAEKREDLGALADRVVDWPLEVAGYELAIVD